MKLLYEINPTKNKKLKTNMSQGIFYVLNESNQVIYSHEAKSGGWGKGSLPTGKYMAVWYTEKTEPAFTQYGIGWLLSLVPRFETTRNNLAIHPDGNVEGSEGCIVLNFATLDDNIRCRNMLRDIMELGTVELTVMQLSIPQGVA